MACNAIVLSSGATFNESVTSSTFTTYYMDTSTFDVGTTLFYGTPCVLSVPGTPGNEVADGYYYYTGGTSPTVGYVYRDIYGDGYVYYTQAITSFEDCCDSRNVFNVAHDTGTFNLGEIYYLQTTSFTGCATVVTYDILQPIYVSTLSTGSYDGCTNCLTGNSLSCSGTTPTPTPTKTPTNTPTPTKTPTNTPTPTKTPAITPTPSSTPAYPGLCPIAEYCLDTGGIYAYDGTFYHVGTYLSHDYYVGNGISTGYLFFDGIKWCLSDTLGGDCILFGRIPCATECPDINGLTPGPCATTTTTTNPCDIINFDAIFDCNAEIIPSQTPTPTQTPSPTPTVTPGLSPTPTPTVTPTTGLSPTPTPTQTITPTNSVTPTPGLSPTTTPTTTPTPTPTTTQLCYGTSITLSSTTLPGESPTPTPTPSATPLNRDKCFTGDATFDIMNEDFTCLPII